MPITFLDAIDFTKVPALGFVAPMVSADPSGYEAGIIYNSTSKEFKYHNGTSWIALGPAGAGGPPTGAAGGDLSGSYPNPSIAAGVIVDADINASAAIATSKINGLDAALAGKALASTNVFAGNGLVGGGDLSTNRTIDFVAGDTTLTVSTDSVVVASAPKWTTGRTIALTGDVTGTSVAFDGSAALSFATAIGAGVIVDADVNSAAAIATSKISGLDTALSGRALTTTDMVAGSGLTGGGTLAATRTFNVGAGTGITVNADDVAVNRTTVDTWYVGKAGDTMTGLLTLSADPTNPLHAATKQYVDLASQGFAFKSAVRVVALTNITLSGTQTIDGVAVAAGNRVLVANQTTASQNGIYVVAAGAWTRSTDMDANGELVDGTMVPVAQGTVGADSQYMCTAIGADPWVVNSSTSTWTRWGGISDLVGGAGLVKTGSTLDVVAGDTTITVNADNIVVNSAVVEVVSRKGAVNGYAALDGTTKVPIAQIPTGTTSTTVALGNHTHADVPTSRQVIAGNGLTGGGALTADVTLNVVGDANLSVAADLVSVLSAPKWTTARSFTLTGDVTGTVTGVDGSGNISIATTVASAGTGAKHFAGDVPSGASCLITHNLASRDVVVQVYRNSGNYDTVMCDVQRTSTNTVTLIFASAVTAGQFRCVVTGR